MTFIAYDPISFLRLSNFSECYPVPLSVAMVRKLYSGLTLITVCPQSWPNVNVMKLL